MAAKEKMILSCPKCQSKMVKQSDVAILTKFEREPSGRVCFSLTDDIPVVMYVCSNPKCNFVELYYDVQSRHAEDAREP